MNRDQFKKPYIEKVDFGLDFVPNVNVEQLAFIHGKELEEACGAKPELTRAPQESPPDNARVRISSPDQLKLISFVGALSSFRAVNTPVAEAIRAGVNHSEGFFAFFDRSVDFQLLGYRSVVRICYPLIDNNYSLESEMYNYFLKKPLGNPVQSFAVNFNEIVDGVTLGYDIGQYTVLDTSRLSTKLTSASPMQPIEVPAADILAEKGISFVFGVTKRPTNSEQLGSYVDFFALTEELAQQKAEELLFG